MSIANHYLLIYRLSVVFTIVFASLTQTQAQEEQLTEQPTPPIAPRTQPAPLPPTIELPAPPSLIANAPNQPLTADEAALIALRNQPEIAIAQANIQAAQGRVQQARSGLFPSLGIGAGYTRVESLSGTAAANNTGGNGIGGSATGYQASASVNQLIFDFNRTRNLVRQAIASERAAFANLTRVQSDLALRVKQAFYTYVQNSRLVAVNEANVRARQAQLGLAEARLNTGLGIPSDVARAQTAVSDAILGLTLARNNAANARVFLALLMGIDPRTPIQTAESSEAAIAAEEVNALVDTALTKRPEAVQLQSQIEAARFGVSAARATNAPTISLNLGVSTRGEDFPTDRSSFSIGASIQWNPFDGGFTAGLVREAQANVQATQAEYENVRLGIISDVSQAYLNLRTSEQGVETARASVASAEEAVRLAEGRFRAGVGIFVEVTDAQAELITAQTNLVNAQSAVEQARAALRRAIGAPVVPTTSL